MTMPAFTSADLDALREWDTPTICNGLELIVPERRGLGFTVDPLVAWDPALPPIVGVARVGTIRAKEPPRGQVADRADWYDYVARAEHLEALGPGGHVPERAVGDAAAGAERLV